MDCQVCTAIAADGYNSTGYFHCNFCHAIWTGRDRAHCTLCHQTFNTPGGAEHHWTKEFGHFHPVNLPDVFSLRHGIWYINNEWNPALIFRNGAGNV